MQAFSCLLLLLSATISYQKVRPVLDLDLESLQPGTEFVITIEEWLEPTDTVEVRGSGLGLCSTGEITYARNQFFKGRLPLLPERNDREPQFTQLQMTENRHLKEIGRSKPGTGAGIRFEYPPLKRGDVVPIYGAVCRVMDVKHDSRNERRETMLLRVLTDNETPPGVRHPLLKHALPFGAIMPGPYTAPSFRLLKYLPPTDSEPQPAVRAELTVNNPYKPVPIERLVVGDIIQLPPNRLAKSVIPPRLVIRDIVPPDEKTKVIGWILVEAEQFVETSPADALAPRNPR